MLPLEGVRVVDLTQVMAGPYSTMILADLGAEVIKIEPPGRGDLARRMGGAHMKGKGDDNAPFLALNRNKRSVVLDLKDEAGREAFRALVPTANIVVESFRPGVTKKLGVDYESLRELRPDLIYASVSGFGQSGPYATRPGFDLIAQGMSGIMSVTGEDGGNPVKCGIPVSDLGAGMFCAIAVLGAYIHWERTGEGQRVDTSLFEAAVALSVWETAELWSSDRVPQPFGSAHRLNAPYQALRARDGYLTVGAITPRQWAALCDVIERPGLAEDERFHSNDVRMKNRALLVDELEEALAAKTSEEWVAQLLEAGVPSGPINDYRKVCDDPHIKAREMVMEIDHPVEGRIRNLGFPYKMSGTPPRVRRPPPLLGEHTEEVFSEIDYRPGSDGGAA